MTITDAEHTLHSFSLGKLQLLKKQSSFNPFNDNNNTINTSPSSSTTNQNNQTQYNQIVDSAGTGNINMEEIVDFREKSGMDGREYSEFLDKIKKRGGNEAFYDAGFVKGPGQMITKAYPFTSARTMQTRWEHPGIIQYTAMPARIQTQTKHFYYGGN